MLTNSKKPEEYFTLMGRCDPADTLPMSQPSSTLHEPAGAPVRSVVSVCTVITGNLQTERDAQVDGCVHGDIHCAQLIVSRDATINGDIHADEVVVRGRVKGTIRANNVILQDTARVESEIFYRSLIIDQGASFEGQSHRIREPGKAVANAPPNAHQEIRAPTRLVSSYR